MSDGAILPSFMRMKPSNPYDSWAERVSNDIGIHVGVVVASYSPTDENNYSKTVYEYDVDAQTSNGQGLSTTVRYPRCRLQTFFGGLADKLIWTPRVQIKNKDGTIKEPGTQVVIQAVNGISRQGVIIACMEPEGAPEQSEDFKDGPRLQWQFNGIDVLINKDGELTLTRMGATNGEGKIANKVDQDGANIRITKDGRIHVETADAKNYVTIDMDSGTISINSDKEFTIDTGKIETTTQQGVKLGGDEKLVLGDTYTAAEGDFLTALTTFVGQLIGIASTLQASTDPATIAAAPQLQAAGNALLPKIVVFQTKLKSKTVLSRKNTTE